MGGVVVPFPQHGQYDGPFLLVFGRMQLRQEDRGLFPEAMAGNTLQTTHSSSMEAGVMGINTGWIKAVKS